jgi:hypothetical protein
MEMVNSYLKMAIDISDNLSMEWQMDMGNTFGSMEVFIKVILNMA